MSQYRPSNKNYLPFLLTKFTTSTNADQSMFGYRIDRAFQQVGLRCHSKKHVACAVAGTCTAGVQRSTRSRQETWIMFAQSRSHTVRKATVTLTFFVFGIDW